MGSERTSLKGRGADLFAPGSEPGSASAPAHQHAGKPAAKPLPRHPKATYYLPAELQRRLDDAWFRERRREPGSQKMSRAKIVELALDVYLSQLEKKRHF